METLSPKRIETWKNELTRLADNMRSTAHEDLAEITSLELQRIESGEVPLMVPSYLKSLIERMRAQITGYRPSEKNLAKETALIRAQLLKYEERNSGAEML